MKENTNKGILVELFCELAFTEYGLTVLKPISTDSRYDYVVDINNKLYRIQVKTPEINSQANSFLVRTSTVNWNTKERTPYTKNEIDAFFTRFGDKNYLYFLKDDEILPKRVLTFNLNSQGLHNAEDFEFDKVMKEKFNLEPKNLIPNEILVKKKIQNKATNNCLDCGTAIRFKAKRCKKCAEVFQLLNSKRKDVSKDMLKHDLRTMPSLNQIAKKYNTSDRTIVKWCNKYGLPHSIKDIQVIDEITWENI